ncbi:MAG: hypothetical protein H6644_12005 [Caldilineaceae bacterium]|nr:hypothetical protein [Caldilineaceae bacterium]
MTLARRAWLPLLAALLLGVAVLLTNRRGPRLVHRPCRCPLPTEESAPPAPTRARRQQ